MTKEQFINHGWTLVWENEAPTSEFGAQTIPIDLSEYDEVAVVARSHTTVEHQEVWFSLIGGGDTCMWTMTSISASTAIYVSWRVFTPTATGVSFTANTRKSATVTTAGQTANGFIIPCYIYAR